MDTIDLYVRAALKHVLSEPVPIIRDESDSDQESDEDESIKPETELKLFDSDSTRAKPIRRHGKPILPKNNNKQKVKKKESRLGAYGIELLDFNGPKLILGIENWLLFYKILGQINWVGKPLYISVAYKLVPLTLTIYGLWRRAVNFYKLDLTNDSYKNPIFLFIQSLAFVVILVQFLAVFKTNLIELCPMYKILTTPKLCFLKEDVLHKIGTKSLRFYLIFCLYQSTLVSLLASRNMNQFINEFQLLTFMLDLLTNVYFVGTVMGISMLDLYIRSAFGHWLLALQCYLEQRFTHLHRYQRQSIRRRAKLALRTECISLGVQSSALGSMSAQPSLITFDEIQKSLNNMDDHLEILRTIQIGVMLNISLLAFLADGATFLLSYHLIVNQRDLYHGLIFFLVAINYLFFIFFSYFGDSWLYYALSAFAQTVEDEYFTQSEIIKAPNSISDNLASTNSNLELVESSHMSIDRCSSANSNIYQTHRQLILIRKKDVLFCREFLHQFENHLATPWSKLTLITHIHLLRTFVTLIAAQIIFDHEH